MTPEQATQLIQALRNLTEQINVIRDIVEIKADLNTQQRLEVDNKSRERRGLAPR